MVARSHLIITSYVHYVSWCPCFRFPSEQTESQKQLNGLPHGSTDRFFCLYKTYRCLHNNCRERNSAVRFLLISTSRMNIRRKKLPCNIHQFVNTDRQSCAKHYFSTGDIFQSFGVTISKSLFSCGDSHVFNIVVYRTSESQIFLFAGILDSDHQPHIGLFSS